MRTAHRAWHVLLHYLGKNELSNFHVFKNQYCKSAVFFRQSEDIRDVNNHRAPQRIGMQPFSNFSELLATSCSYTNFMMVSQMVQELSRWQNKQTNRQTDKHTHKRTLPKTNQGRDDVTSSTNCFKCQFKCTSSVGTSRKLKTRHSAEWRIRWYGRIFFSWSK